MEKKVIERLQLMGYSYDKKVDGNLLKIFLCIIEDFIKNRINDTEIPSELENVYIDMVCGEFLKQKKAIGALNGFDFEQAIETIKLGDATVTQKSGLSPEQQFDAYIQRLLNHDEDFVCYRKLVW